MENALKLLDPSRGIGGGVKPVNIGSLEKDREAARNDSYVCIDARCHTTVRPSFPDLSKPGRRRSPRSYFSARKPFVHTDECQGLSQEELEAIAKVAPTSETKPGNDTRQKIPSRFREEPRRTRIDADMPGQGAAGPEDGMDRPRRLEPIATGRGRTGTSTVSTVRTLVHHWLTDWPSSQDADLSIDQCPGATYGQCFRGAPISEAELFRNARHRFVYYGPIRDVRNYGSRRIVVDLGLKSEPLSGQAIRIILGDDMLSRGRDAIAKLRDNRKPSLSIYALGAFVPDKQFGGWVIEITRPENFWVEELSDA